MILPELFMYRESTGKRIDWLWCKKLVHLVLTDATSNKCHANSKKCLTSSNKKLLELNLS